MKTKKSIFDLGYIKKILTLIKTLIKLYSLINSDYLFLYDILDIIDCLDPKDILNDVCYAKLPDLNQIGEEIKESNYDSLGDASRELIHEWAKTKDLPELNNNIARLDLDNKVYSESTEVPEEEKSRVCSTIGKIKEVILNQIDEIKKNT